MQAYGKLKACSVFHAHAYGATMRLVAELLSSGLGQPSSGSAERSVMRIVNCHAVIL